MEQQLDGTAPKQSREFTSALTFVLDYKPAEDGIMLTSALAQMIVDYNKSVSTPSPSGFTEGQLRCAFEEGRNSFSYEVGGEFDEDEKPFKNFKEFLASLPTSDKVEGVENLSQDGTQC